MIQLKTLTVRNFMSYGNNVTVFQLDQPGTTLVLGENLDSTDEGVGSNGVGKTTMLQGIVYALYDRIITPPGEEVPKDSLVNHFNKEQLEVTLEFIAENGCAYKIHRQRKMKKHGPDANNTFLYENGVDISVDAAGTTKKIEEIIGMPYDMFARIIVFSASNQSFLKLPATSTSGPNQKAFIEDLLGLSEITEKAETLKKQIKDTKASLDTKKVQIDAQKAERDRHATQVSHAKKRLADWDLQRTSSIKTLESKLAKVDGIDVEGQRAVHAKLKQVDTKRVTVKQAKQEATRTCREHMAQFEKLDKQLVSLRKNKCPHCEQPYAKALDEIETNLTQMEKLEASITAENESITECTAMIEDLDALYDDLKQQITVDDIEAIARIQSDVENIRARIAELRVEENPHLATVKELEEVVFDDLNMEEVDKLQKELDHQNFLLKLLTKSDSFVRKTLVTKYLPFLNQRLAYYLQMLGMAHIVQFQDDLSVKITHGDAEVRFGLLSNGQKARVDFGLSVAFKDVRERLHGRLNLCMFDEVLDFGLDAVGVAACARVIKHLARTEGVSMYIVSHRNEIDSVFDRRMTIQMIKKFSYVRVDG